SCSTVPTWAGSSSRWSCPARSPPDAGSAVAVVPPSVQFGAQLLAQHVDGDGPSLALDVPVGPAVAGRRALQVGADLVDRPADVAGGDRAVGAHAHGVAPALVEQGLARRDQPALDQPAEGDARRVAARGRRVDVALVERLD